MKTVFVILAIVLGSTCQLTFAQNLLINGAFGGGDNGFSSDYVFIPSGQSQTPDTFGIRTNSQDFNPAYTLFGDHTTGTGMMALFDGYPAPAKAAWSETVSVSPRTYYLFSGWTTSADPFNPGTLRLLINGSPAGADLSLSTNAGVWTNVAIVWNSGTNFTATLAIVDVNTIDYGNDFAVDDLSFVSLEPVLAIRQTGAQAFELSWKSLTNITYQLQWTSSLNSGNNWQDLGSPFQGNDATSYFNDMPSTQTTKFYRLKVLF